MPGGTYPSALRPDSLASQQGIGCRKSPKKEFLPSYFSLFPLTTCRFRFFLRILQHFSEGP